MEEKFMGCEYGDEWDFDDFLFLTTVRILHVLYFLNQILKKNQLVVFQKIYVLMEYEVDLVMNFYYYSRL